MTKLYWIDVLNGDKQWTVGLRYDEFRNQERTPSDATTEFDYLFRTPQVYADYYVPFKSDQAWNMGLYVGYTTMRRDHLDAAVNDTGADSFEVMLRTGWEIFSFDKSTVFAVAVSWNIDDLFRNTFDGGAIRLRSSF